MNDNSTGNALPPSTRVRITSKGLKHPETGKVLRTQYPAFTLDVAAIATFDATTIGRVCGQLISDKVKELAQLKERASWISGQVPFDPAKPAEVAAWWKGALEGVTLEDIYSALFDAATRTTAFGVSKWKDWLKGQFIPALDRYYGAEGKGAMSAAKVAATLAIMGAGREMAEHNVQAFATRFLAMLECEHESVLEVVAGETAQQAFAWVTAPRAAANSNELEL